MHDFLFQRYAVHLFLHWQHAETHIKNATDRLPDRFLAQKRTPTSLSLPEYWTNNPRPRYVVPLLIYPPKMPSLADFPSVPPFARTHKPGWYRLSRPCCSNNRFPSGHKPPECPVSSPFPPTALPLLHHTKGRALPHTGWPD